MPLLLPIFASALITVLPLGMKILLHMVKSSALWCHDREVVDMNIDTCSNASVSTYEQSMQMKHRYVASYTLQL